MIGWNGRRTVLISPYGTYCNSAKIIKHLEILGIKARKRPSHPAADRSLPLAGNPSEPFLTDRSAVRLIFSGMVRDAVRFGLRIKYTATSHISQHSGL